MKLKLFLVLTILITAISLLCSCGEAEETTLPEESESEPAFTEPVETEPEETEPPHVHSYEVSEVIKGTCVEDGYEVYRCSCGLSYKNLVAAEHTYKEVKSSDGQYIKKLCSLCGDYKIVRNQSYVFNLTFDGYTDYQKAVNDDKNLSFYTANKADGSKGYVELRKELNETYLYITESNFCVWDDTNTVTSKKFIASMDVNFERLPSVPMYLFSVSYTNSKGNVTYNNGILSLNPDGSVTVGKCAERYPAKLKDKGYNNITIVYDPQTGLADVYVNEKLMAREVEYVKTPSDISKSYIRYFDRKIGFAASADNLKVYIADKPEFIVPDGIEFKN